MKISEYRKINFLYSFIIVFILWYFIALLIDKAMFPTPVEIMQYIAENFTSKLYIHIFYSIKRILLGILITLIVAVPLGILMGYYKKIDQIFSPILYFNYPVPKTALLPVVMLFLGLGEGPKIAMIILITFFPIVVNIRDKVKNIPDEIYYTMYSLGASDKEIIMEIIFPGIYSTILTSLRISIGTAISILFIAENFGTQFGMGYLIMDSWMRINYIEMYSAIVMLSLVGVVLFFLVDIVEIILCPWKKVR
ncbi:ABC transporter permease [Clostridium sp. DL1XJH146]